MRIELALLRLSFSLSYLFSWFQCIPLFKLSICGTQSRALMKTYQSLRSLFTQTDCFAMRWDTLREILPRPTMLLRLAQISSTQ
ncbi:hypothetical protein EV361DRAFT_23754 [Lentinula raphanica]|nr:hypothetical protein EV361DRAFT_23754 [Lentinula raphanica]